MKACSHSSAIEVIGEKSIEPMVQTIDRDKEKHSRHGTCQNGGIENIISYMSFSFRMAVSGQVKADFVSGNASCVYRLS